MSADTVAQDQIRNFVDRILRLKEEAKSINGDIREVYAEAKGNGFDKTILGKVVSYVEKRAAGANHLAEAEALFDLYLSAYDGVGTAVATHTHEAKSTAARKDVPGKATVRNALAQIGDDPVKAAQPQASHEVAFASTGDSIRTRVPEANYPAGTQAPPVDTTHFISAFTMQGAEVAAPGQVPDYERPVTTEALMEALATTTVTPLFRINPDTHFANSKGLPRLHGCKRPDECAGSHRALCGTCARSVGQGSAA